LEFCLTKACLSSTIEIRDLWLTVADSYRFLWEREERLGADALEAAPSRYSLRAL
jgi:hypothetical protein